MKHFRISNKRKLHRHKNNQFFLVLFLLASMLVGFSVPQNRKSIDVQESLKRPKDPLNSFQSPTSDSISPSTVAWDYFHPTWWGENILSGDSFAVLDQTSGFFSASNKLIADPDGRIEREFLPPHDIKGRVQFWIDIYSKVNSKMRIIHDKRHPEIRFGYIDFRPLYRAVSNPVTADFRAKKYERAILKQLKTKLDEAAGVSKTHLLSPAEKSSIQAFLSRSGALDKSSYQKLVKNIRTQTGQRDAFLQALIRSKYLLPHIESVFKQEGLPVALARIPFVESSFNAKAQSKIGAMGVWQFTPETAKELIHAESSHLWADPLRQTKSAAKLLRSYRGVLPDWGTAVTSYNSGVGRIRRILKKYRVNNIGSLIDLSHQDTLGFAGKNFYSEFLAANFVEAYKEELFGDLLNGTDSLAVFKKNGAVPKEYCDL